MRPPDGTVLYSCWVLDDGFLGSRSRKLQVAGSGLGRGLTRLKIDRRGKYRNGEGDDLTE